MLHRLLSLLTGTTLLLTLAISARAAGPIYPDLAGRRSQRETAGLIVRSLELVRVSRRPPAGCSVRQRRI